MHDTPLKSYHADHKAHMVPFAGWTMPLHYGSVLAEHHQTRRSGGIFDVSHMGRVNFKGLHARRLLEHACTRRIGTMEVGQCRYSLVCNPAGGIMDDVIVNRVDDDEFLVVVNASNRDKLVAHFQALQAQRGWKLTIDDRTMKTAMVALQGPKVMQLIGQVSREIPTLKRYRFLVKNLVVFKLVVSRTGYTGEDGVEVILPSSAVAMALKLLLKDVNTQDAEALLKPAGLGARDTLRMEAGMPLYGHELTEDTNALDTGLDFAIDLDKSADKDGETFIGQDSLLAARSNGSHARRLVGIACDGKRSPRQGMTVTIPGHPDGLVTSGCLSPTLERPIALAYLPLAALPTGFGTKGGPTTGPRVLIDPDKTKIEGAVVTLPFYKLKP